MPAKPVFHPFLLSLLAVQAGAQTLTHRWSFNNSAGPASGISVTDPVSGGNAVVRGFNATFTGTSIQLPGTTDGNQTPAAISGYVDLPNGIVSSKTDLTVEIWASVNAYKKFQRLFDFGRISGTGNGAPGEITGLGNAAFTNTQASDNFMLSMSRDGDSISLQRFAGKLDAAETFIDTTTPTTAGTQYHFVATYQAGVGTYAATGGRMSWYRDGTLITPTLDVPFRLSQIEDVNNWLGRSQWSGDSTANITYDEVRIYSGAMSPAEVSASRTDGPNASLVPTTAADTATLLHGQKVAIPVLTNDSFFANPSTVEIVGIPTAGTAEVLPDGKILYTNTNPAAAADSFTYRVNGGGGFSVPATVTISFSNSLRIANPHLNVPASPPPTTISLVNAFPGAVLSSPVCLATPPGETLRLFVCQKSGPIRVIPDVTAATQMASDFLTIPNVNSSSECGVLGLAFHPQYATNRHFFVFYSVNSGGNVYQRVSRFTTSAGNPNFAEPGTELVLIEQRDEHTNHNGGDLHFGADGYLYISVGDEGAQNDTENNSQRIAKDFFAGILRIDVDKRQGNPTLGIPANLEPNAHPNPNAAISGKPNLNAVRMYETSPGSNIFKAAYSIPIDNPWVHVNQGGTWTGTFNGTAVSAGDLPYVRSEFWAVGMRNPWRFSFDPPTGELWVGDVGQDAREEVDIVTKGGNYGWNYREGKIQRPGSGSPPVSFSSIDPIYDYGHGSGEFTGDSITGGIVYRGTGVPSLTGKYIFADYEYGGIWSLQRNGANPPVVTRIAARNAITAFGTDPSNRDLLLADGNNGMILRLVSTTVETGFPVALSDTGLFADLADLSPSPGMVPYQVNLPFWSDHAEKRRWLIVPDGASDFTWSRDGLWTLPAGTIWVKHFDMRMQRENPNSLKRIETRLIVKNAGGAYGVSYRWNEAGTQATLAADAGENFVLNVTDNGTPVPQTWRIPSRSECMTCHTPQAGHALSFNTRQLNFDDGNMLGFIGNQLATLQQQGFFTNDPGSPNLLPRHVRAGETDFSTEAHARSYLAVNCAYCHKSGGTGLGNFDVRPELTLAQTGLVNGIATNSGADPLNRLVVPGDPLHSIVLQRVGATNGFTRMPPIGSNVIDSANVTLLTEWIDGELDDRMTYDEWRTLEFGADPDGEANLDPDGDGMTNAAEFLAGTLPKSGASALRPQTTVNGGNVKLAFNLPVNRSFQIMTSANLQNWTPWDIPGNQGLPVKGGLVEITRPIDQTQRFFRVEVSEN